MTALDFTVVRQDGSSPENSLAMIDQAAGTVTLADAAAPQLRVDDLSPHRGDGIFETLLVTVDPEGTPHLHAADPHFSRFQESAAMLELPAPQRELFDRAMAVALDDAIAKNPGVTMLSVRYSMTRGVEGTQDHPTAWAITLPVDAHYAQLRETGLRLLTVDRGYDAYFGAGAPWQLIGAKTLSYATNQAAGRWVRAHGGDECLYTSHDGLLLEGPSCNLIIKRGQELLTPDPKAGLLHGTTQRTVFSRAAEAGFLCSYQDLKPEDLEGAEAAWVLSSTRMAVPVNSVNGKDLPVDPATTAQFVQWIIEGA